MDLDYHEIGKRIARRRKQLGLKQSAVEEKADIGYKYLSSIERGISIPSTEVIMRLSLALDTTPDAFLVGTARPAGEEWRGVAELLRGMTPRKLELARRFLTWLSDQELSYKNCGANGSAVFLLSLLRRPCQQPLRWSCRRCRGK